MNTVCPNIKNVYQS